MAEYKYSDRSDGKRNHIGFNLKVYSGSTILVIFILAGLLPIELFSQPFAQGKSKWLGNVYGNTAPQAHWDEYWNQVTPENAGKWLYCEGSRDVETWGGADAAYNFAIARNIPFRWHTFVWGQQYPTWIDALPDTEKAQEVEEWIQHVGERYPQIDFVDVVNEPLTGHAPATYRNALGGAGTTGWDWVIWTFEKARKYLPNAKLYINEYNVINSNTNTANYLQIIRLLKSRGLIDGIGVQGHRFEIESANLNVLKANLDSLGSTGLPIHITEFDLGNIGNSGTPNDSVQLVLYKQRFPLLWEHPAVKGITFWGYLPGLWQSTAYLRLHNGTERPALQWLRSYVVPPPVPTLISPAKYSVGVPRNPKLIWRSTESAIQYGIQVATDSLFTSLIVESIEVPDTTLNMFPLESNTKYFWRIYAANDRDTSEYSAFSSFTTGTQIVSVNEPSDIPIKFILYQNYPNPFNPTTRITFTIPQAGHTTVKIFNTMGQVVATLIENVVASGGHSVEWSAMNIPSGVYFYRLQTENYSETKKLLLLK